MDEENMFYIQEPAYEVTSQVPVRKLGIKQKHEYRDSMTLSVVLGTLEDPATKKFTSDPDMVVDLLLAGNENADDDVILALIVQMDSIIRVGSTVESSG